MAKLFRLACSIEAYLGNPDKTSRPPKPRWLRMPAALVPHRISYEYWTKVYWATPPWIDEQMISEMREMYVCAKPGYHVDHVVPLKSPIVCGLHVPWNLEVVPAAVNLAKSNAMWPGHPCENEDMFDTVPEPHQMSLAL